MLFENFLVRTIYTAITICMFIDFAHHDSYIAHLRVPQYFLYLRLKLTIFGVFVFGYRGYVAY